MRIRFAAVLYAALALALALFAGTALAGGHDQGGGSSQSAQHQSQSQSNKSSTTTSSGDNSTGVKPSNTTKHDTHASASSNQTKQYGNGKTAGQIATQAGYGNATLHGPGNSQPHKTNCGSKHEVDVHALKNKTCGSTESAEHSQHAEHSQTPEHPSTPAQPENAQQSDHKVTICHKTGSATNPFVEITVDEHALKNGHTAAKGDIIPAPAGGCPTAQTQSATQSQTQSEVQAANCATTKTESETVVVGVKHFIGPKGSGRFVIIHPNPNSAHYADKHPDELLTQTVTKTVTVPGTSCTTSSSTQSSTAAATQSSASTQSSTSAAPATAAASPAGSVLGATSPIITHTKKAKPAGGVLGATARLGHTVGATNLPFTGLKLWIFVLIALGLVTLGAVARRASAQR